MEDDFEERIAAAESLAQLQQGSNDNNSQLQLFVEPTPLNDDFDEYGEFYEEATQENKLAQHASIPNTQKWYEYHAGRVNTGMIFILRPCRFLSKIYRENGPTALITVGLVNASSAGLLIYMALVDLLAADFMGPKLQGSIKLQIKSYIAVLLGAGEISVVVYGRETRAVNTSHGCSLWKGIYKLLKLFKNNSSLQVEYNTSVLSWEDHWVGNQALATCFPDLYSIASSKNWTVSACATSIANGGSWNLGLDRRLNQHQIRSLLSSWHYRWSFQWGGSRLHQIELRQVRKFSVKSCYTAIQ
ncbi:hypothetical protein C5167_004064 [Papaver somniferum]|nr:hypothetical protein C5167_004064 [Papaver somniferum]